jgi:putative ABC transport system permease protein
MHNILKIAIRNLMRYKRRTFLVATLIALGVIAVQVFVASSGSYKSLIISQITDAMLGQMQIHKKGYLVSVENVPMNLNLDQHGAAMIDSILNSMPDVEAYSPRIRLAGMISNFVETTNIRLYGISPEKEYRTVPLLPKRVVSGSADLKPGQILVPRLLAKGLGLKVGDQVVIIATNKDGSVNGMQFTVGGIVESAPGPGGRDGYIAISDAAELLRMDAPEVSEIAIHLKNFDKLHAVYQEIAEGLSKQVDSGGKPRFEIHTWESLAPFANVAKMIDIMSIMVKMLLIAIVLVSIMDVMIMSVYERTREIGTLSAIGTMPGKILGIFVSEGAFLGLFGVVLGNLVALAVVYAIRFSNFTFSFGMKEGFILMPRMAMPDVLFVSLVVIGVSVIGSLQPAFKASRMEPIKALRSV